MIALHPDDDRFPPALRDLAPAPDPLWIDGDVRVIAGPCVAIVGTRRMSPYGERVARELAAALARAGAVVVSGLAQGIDCAAHASAIEAGGSSVAVLGEGVTSFLANARGRRRRLAVALRERGALLSPYPPIVPARGWMFVKRNAVIAALSRAVVVVEAPVGSGALITAADAVRLGRPLFAVPGPLGARTAEGTNALIASGAARACLGPSDVARVLGLDARASAATADPLLEALAAGPLDLDALAHRTRTDRSALRARLVSLVLAGAIVDRGDGRFARAATAAPATAARATAQER
ncbi:MAG TPA: DNA-processing protein DprA [Candidatus Limnocylindria bacterium]|nr:DNA-processing protein DprA [Candidatus Limnocylindria bacterium]